MAKVKSKSKASKKGTKKGIPEGYRVTSGGYTRRIARDPDTLGVLTKPLSRTKGGVTATATPTLRGTRVLIGAGEEVHPVTSLMRGLVDHGWSRARVERLLDALGVLENSKGKPIVSPGSIGVHTRGDGWAARPAGAKIGKKLLGMLAKLAPAE